jgi:cobalt-zinc-cadmium resistance protein CzcA
LEAAAEVGKPVLFGVGIIILVFMPLLSLEVWRAKCSHPWRLRFAIALAISLILSFTLSPGALLLHLEGWQRRRYQDCEKLRTPYDRWLSWSLVTPN